jgi:protein-S-isoprenylcysteine O-methyltransferase Ste14
MTVRSAAALLAPHLRRPWARRTTADPLGEPPGNPLERRNERRFDPADALGRLVIIVLFSLLAVRIATNFQQTGRFTGLLLLVGEVLVVALTVFRRSAVRVDRTWRARLLTGLSLSGPLLLRPLTTAGLLGDAITTAISGVGLLISVGGKLSLGRSFGLMPANRGIVCAGLYRVVRHPIYSGYLISHAAFVLAYPSLWNLIALVVADAALLARAAREEGTLAEDPEYKRYLQVVRWRVCPGLF